MECVFGVLLCAALASGLALDHNTIRGRDPALQNVNSQRSSRRGSERSHSSQCPGPDCVPRSCSNRAQRRSSKDREVSLPEPDTHHNNMTRVASGCVRSSDCGRGLCCVRYLTARRCQRVPSEGELCLLRGSKQRRHNLGRCDCGAGLTCARGAGLTHGEGAGLTQVKKGQGVCVSEQHGGQRRTPHTGKKRRTAEDC